MANPSHRVSDPQSCWLEPSQVHHELSLTRHSGTHPRARRRLNKHPTKKSNMKINTLFALLAAVTAVGFGYVNASQPSIAAPLTLAAPSISAPPATAPPVDDPVVPCGCGDSATWSVSQGGCGCAFQFNNVAIGGEACATPPMTTDCTSPTGGTCWVTGDPAWGGAGCIGNFPAETEVSSACFGSQANMYRCPTDTSKAVTLTVTCGECTDQTSVGG